MSDKGIDWDEVKQRLHASRAALEQAGVDTPERLEALYRARAERLARRQARRSASADRLRVLVFTLGAERYAIQVSDLIELLPLAGCTPVPGGPAALLGVANIHGEIRSVLDLSALLNHPPAGRGPGYVLIVRKGDRTVALRVDGLDRIELVGREELAVVDDPGGPSRGSLQGLTPDRLRLLNTGALLAHPIFRRGVVE